MVHVLMLALTCAAAASAASYADYSGVKMPQYGGAADYDLGRDPPPSHPSDDYHGHSPDAPASLDYKFEEKPRVRTDKPTKDAEELDVWRKTGRKHRELIRPEKNDNNVRQKYDDDEDDEIPNFTTIRRYSKHRSRLKNEIDQVDEETPPRRHNKYSRDRKDDVSDIYRKEYLHINKDFIPEDKNKEFDEEVKLIREVTTKRPNRRRPRDKELKRQLEDEYVEDNWPEVATKTDRELENDVPHIRDEPQRRQRLPPEQRVGPTREREFKHERERVHERGRDRDRDRDRTHLAPLAEDEEDQPRDDPVKVMSGKFKAKAYDEYDDYYDMKRVQNIKSKIPTLLQRRTSARVMVPTKTRRMNTKLNEDVQELMSTGRMLKDTTDTDVTPDTTEIDTTLPTRTTTASTTTIPVTTITTTVPIPITTPLTTTPTSTTTVSTTLKFIQKETKPSTKQMLSSITGWPNEAARLAILQKVQRKEGLHYQSTKKPPVLMQVTKYVPTVVMVEPPISQHPMLRSDQKFQEESPERLLKIKRMMRRKLVANAKNIHDLTDNWDDLVCDYIDTTLLSATRALTPTVGISCLQLYLLVIKLITSTEVL